MYQLKGSVEKGHLEIFGLKCFVGFIVQRNKTFPLFLIRKTDAVKKTDFFAHVIYLENKTKSSKKKKMTLLNTGTLKQTSMENLELFWQCSILVYILYNLMPFFP